MKITKFEHACFTVEKNGKTIVVDPGAYTTNFICPSNVTGIIITHKHADHLDNDLIADIIEKNPGAIIIGHGEVMNDLDNFATKKVTANENIILDDFELDFYGGDHAVILDELPTDVNLGVMIDHQLYYPGDSFTIPSEKVTILAYPVAGPWLKFSEAAAFLRAVKPELAFPTHDAVLSEGGKNLPDQMLAQIAEEQGTKYQRLHEPLIFDEQ